ncbi:amidophosphoribosyltransferase [Aulographum hederae CBS 113979]|uniref:amidophosphoribosyltransferase n=1 Tax=Aulographum hederae CBS 113979 TaxID=1176131 RepID=A0A6G1H7E3_9PEZI|nr:amidophosphoribosyltransferase [Aulographum hederae CBS 113979]
MCGIIAVLHGNTSSTEAGVEIHDALYLLQHRGQDAAGIATCASGGRIYQCKGNGMASKVFHDGARVTDLPGYMGLGHLRYPTAGSSANSEAQPFYVNSPYGICFTHNGNLINAPELKRFLDKEAHRHINTDSDSELMLNIFANELNETGKARVNPDDCFAALERTYNRCVGGWACTAMIAGFGLIGFRDPYGIRPMVLGWRDGGNGKTDYMMASESVALQQCGYDSFQDIMPGQAVIISKRGHKYIKQVAQPLNYAPDIFEYVYFARPDSTIDGIDVDEARRNMGYMLGENIKRRLGPELLAEIDCVMPIPETSVTSAQCVAECLGKPYILGFIKNRYIFRTFIMPSQKQRQKGVRAKLNPMKKKFEGQNVLLVDDSIVRGTTSREIVNMAREKGAKKVIFTSCAPPITNAHIYGIDLASTSELIAHDRTSQSIADVIGADAVIYQDLDDLIKACASSISKVPPKSSSEAVNAVLNGGPKEFEVGVFNGKYVTPVNDGYFKHLERIRGITKKAKVIEKAKEAVVAGCAGEKEKAVVTGGAVVDENGNVIPVKPCSSTPNGAIFINGEKGHDHALTNGHEEEDSEDDEEEEEEGGGSGQEKHIRVKESQDISLHNLNDH